MLTLSHTMHDGSEYEVAVEMERQRCVDPMSGAPLPREGAPIAVEHKHRVPVVETRVLISTG